MKASKKKLIRAIPFIGKKPLQLRSCLVNSIENDSKFCKLKVVLQSPCKLNLLFCYKDSLKKKICFGIVYRYMCSNYKLKHMGISNLTGKRLKSVKTSAVSDRLIEQTVAIELHLLEQTLITLIF